MDTDPVSTADEPIDENDESPPLETVGTREVDEADAVEQSRAVPDDEDYPHG